MCTELKSQIILLYFSKISSKFFCISITSGRSDIPLPAIKDNLSFKSKIALSKSFLNSFISCSNAGYIDLKRSVSALRNQSLSKFCICTFKESRLFDNLLYCSLNSDILINQRIWLIFSSILLILDSPVCVFISSSFKLV